MQPSFSTQVKSSSPAYFSAARAPSKSGMPLDCVQPFTLMMPSRASTAIIMRCLPIALTSSSKKSVFKTDCAPLPLLRLSDPPAKAAEPMITFSAPKEINSFARFTVRMPPPARILPLRKRLASSAELGVCPLSGPSSVWVKAASKSITAVSPYILNSAAKESASVRESTGSFPFLS